MENKTCGECKHYLAKMFHCQKHDVMAESHQTCEDFEPKHKPTNGDKIRQMSDEELAEKLVYEQVVINTIQINDSYSSHNKGSCTKMWKSALLPMKFFDDKQTALEATIEELKKDVNHG